MKRLLTTGNCYAGLLLFPMLHAHHTNCCRTSRLILQVPLYITILQEANKLLLGTYVFTSMLNVFWLSKCTYTYIYFYIYICIRYWPLCLSYLEKMWSEWTKHFKTPLEPPQWNYIQHVQHFFFRFNDEWPDTEDDYISIMRAHQKSEHIRSI